MTSTPKTKSRQAAQELITSAKGKSKGKSGIFGDGELPDDIKIELLKGVKPHKVQFSFSEAVAEPGREPMLSPTRYIKLLKTDVTKFAGQAHVHRNTVSRAPGAASVQDYLRKNLRVLSAAFDASGQDEAKALQWFRNEPLAPFEYKTAEQLVSDGRAEDVIRLIESYSAGAAG